MPFQECKLLYTGEKNSIYRIRYNFFQFSSTSLIVRCVLVWLITSFSMLASANQQKNEPTNGTVQSFKAMKKRFAVPPLKFFDKEIQPENFTTFHGKIVLLNIWATWCGPCLKELPALDRLQSQFDKSKFVILPISIDEENPVVISAYLKKLGLKNLDFYHDVEKQLKSFFPVDVVPANFIIDRNGKMISFLRGFVDWDQAQASEMIKYYVDQKDGVPKVWKPSH